MLSIKEKRDMIIELYIKGQIDKEDFEKYMKLLNK